MTLSIPLSPARLHRLPGLVVFGATDIGTVRSNNEDNFLLDEAHGLAMLADGMGGHAAGEVASAAVLTEMHGYLAVHAPGLATIDVVPGSAPDPDITWSDPAASAKRLLHDAVNHANTSLHAQNRASRRGDGNGMGATLTGFWRPSGAAPLVSFHVGDSRLYRWRDGTLDQLTRDQTLYQQALEMGAHDRLPPRNLLLQAVGPAASITAEVRSHTVEPGDILMLCSDGLHGSVPARDLDEVLRQADVDTLAHDCARLIEMAKASGSRDNITVILALCLPG